MLNSEVLLTLSSIEDTSKIKKVYLEMMNDIKEFYSILKLYPRMEYFTVNSITCMDFKFVLRYIFKKTKHDCNNDLRLLCFRIPKADDEAIKKFKKRMINFEKFLLHYTIKRVADNLFIGWQ